MKTKQRLTLTPRPNEWGGLDYCVAPEVTAVVRTTNECGHRDVMAFSNNLCMRYKITFDSSVPSGIFEATVAATITEVGGKVGR